MPEGTAPCSVVVVHMRLAFTNTIYLNVKRLELVQLFIFQLKRSACASENPMCWFKTPPLFMLYIK